MTASAGPALKELYSRYGDRVAFVTLYVREAHPGDLYPQPRMFEQKMTHARAYERRDQIPWDVAVDDITGSLHRALDPKPNAVYLMDTDGSVVFRSLWANDTRKIARALEQLVKGYKPLEQRETRAIPLLRGLGVMHETLGRSGKVAKRDMLRQAPPLYALALVARLFRPLSPLGRSIAALSLVVAGTTFIGWQLGKRRRA